MIAKGSKSDKIEEIEKAKARAILEQKLRAFEG
jgi:hypothetical protein